MLLPYEQAFNRIRAEYMEMPGMRLTPQQVERLCGVDSGVCRVVLDDLVRAQFLHVNEDGSYTRRTDHNSPFPATPRHYTAPDRAPALSSTRLAS